MDKKQANEIRVVAKKIEEEGLEIDLDDRIHEHFSKLASEINNQGIEAQLKWLVVNAGEDLDVVLKELKG